MRGRSFRGWEDLATEARINKTDGGEETGAVEETAPGCTTTCRERE